MLWLLTKAFESRFQKVLLKEGHLSDTASAWRQHDKLAATKRRPKRRGLQHWPLTPEPELPLEHIGEVEGSRTRCACLTALGTEAALSFGIQQLRPQEPRNSAQAPSTAERDPDLLKLLMITQDYQE